MAHDRTQRYKRRKLRQRPLKGHTMSDEALLRSAAMEAARHAKRLSLEAKPTKSVRQ